MSLCYSHVVGLTAGHPSVVSLRISLYLAALVLLASAGCGRYGYDELEPVADFIDCELASDTGHCYAVSIVPTGWQAARDACREALGPTAHLVTIDSPEENAWAQQYAASIPYDPSVENPNQRKRMWLAGNDLDTVGVWTWSTGEPFEYQNWRDGEPDNPGTEQCLIMLGEYGGLWDDRPCDRDYEYLCERERL